LPTDQRKPGGDIFGVPLASDLAEQLK